MGWALQSGALRAGVAEHCRHINQGRRHITGVIGWIILGLVAGAIAKAVHSGPEPGGLLGTLLVGIFGALIGGFIASAVGIGEISSFFNLGTWLIAIAGAILLLLIYEAVATRGDRTDDRRIRGV
jgi:uncharacterized membrane protein YeaQ/YmgE (transglycosylase-associated protein family)